MNTFPLKMRNYWKPIGFFISLLLGVVFTFMPWGDEGGFHGVGVPVPHVIWDKGKDYVSIIGIPLNILFFVGLWALTVLAVATYSFLKKLLSGNSSLPNNS
ncbi:hypothetical protein Rhal01_03718 [Rubritalea halochordaticola]|uniref:DUF4321 domain-containing protein n=1 Tax=Rubritalea halochordaticola TaxID=714537 RepID=A0ABP9V831_9BACT